MALQAGGDIDRIAPEVEKILLPPQHTRDDGTEVHTDPEIPPERLPLIVAQVPCELDHVQPALHAGEDGIRGVLQETGDGHERIADRLDLLDAEFPAISSQASNTCRRK